jgi:Leucine-rich repeat (LRR) protein
MKYLFTLALILLSFSVFAQTINFPDETLKSKLVNYTPNIDINNDSEIQVSEAQAYTGGLDLQVDYSSTPYEKIENLEGLEYFENVNYLNLNYNDPFELIDFSNLESLDSLKLRHVDVVLDTLKVLDNQNLQKLDLSENGNAVFKVSNLSNLEYLNLTHDDFSDGFPAEINSLPSLRKLDIVETNISDVDGL